MENLFIKYPEKGDIVVGELSTGSVKFIKLSTYSDANLNTSLYEKIGVVARRTGNEVLIVYKENAGKLWCNRAWWYLGGYTLDGTSRSGILSLRFAHDSWAANHDKTIAYNATTIEQFVEQLNSAFAADSDMDSQDWYADIEDDKVRIHCNNTSWQQCSYNSAKNGFSLTGSLPEITTVANMRRKHGGNGGEGAISNWHRALACYRNDNGKDSYMGGRTSLQSSVKQGYPINLPTWLGTSTKNPGDFCAPLRAIYGEGEEGWLRFMKTCMPVVPTDFGNMGMRNGLERTKVLASFKYTSRRVATLSAMCAGADYAFGKGTRCIPQGNWYLPTVDDIYHILDGLKYGTSGSRTADPLNEGLYKIGGSAISNGSILWSCLRYYSYYAWVANGGYGFFGGGNMYGSFSCVPVSLYYIV